MLRSLIYRWVVIFLAVLLAGYLLPTYIRYDDFGQVAIFAIVLALLNAFIRPIVLLVTCPINVITLGLFTLVVNALIFWLAGSLVPGITLSGLNGFGGAFLGAIIVSVVSFVMNRVVK